jgi:hypothetical protein
MSTSTVSTPPPTEAPAPKPRKERRDCPYTAAELHILRKYKRAYLHTTTHPQRATLVNSLLVKIQNYWEAVEGQRPAEEVKRRTEVSVGLIDLFHTNIVRGRS